MRVIAVPKRAVQSDSHSLVDMSYLACRALVGVVEFYMTSLTVLKTLSNVGNIGMLIGWIDSQVPTSMEATPHMPASKCLALGGSFGSCSMVRGQCMIYDFVQGESKIGCGAVITPKYFCLRC